MNDKDNKDVEQDTPLNTNEEIVDEIKTDLSGADELKDDVSGDDVSESDKSEVEQIDLLQQAQKEASEQKDLALRTLADMENLRRRTRIDLENAHKYSLERFVKEIIPVVDSMELGLSTAKNKEVKISSIVEGMEMTLKQMLDVLQSASIERISPVGEVFNPEFHEAMTMVPNPDVEPNTVLEVIQKGYTLNERIVRPSRVIVSK